MPDEVKPCPFCGAPGEFLYGSIARCSNWECWTHLEESPSPEEWNARPIEDLLHAENKRLRDALTQIMRRGDSMDATPLGTQRQERNIWRGMRQIAVIALQAEFPAE